MGAHTGPVNRRVGLLLLVATVGVAAASLAGTRWSAPSLTTFAGKYEGHGESLTISRSGVGTAEIYSGCCDFVLALTFQLSHPRLTRSGLPIATETAIRVKIGDRSAFGGPWQPPHVGQVATLRLTDGNIMDELSGATYCSSGKHWVCGA